MGISSVIFILFLLAIIFLVVGFVVRKKILKGIGLLLLLVSLGLGFIVYNALSYM